MKKFLLILCLVFTISCNAETTKLHDGDLIFQTSTSSQSQAIQAATHSKYSHMGLVYRKDGVFYVLEAVQPVKLTPLADWIRRGKGGHYVVKRLKQAEVVLTPSNLMKLKAEGIRYLGKNYDLYFEWSDEQIYCSELVWKVYKNALGIELGRLQRFSEFDLADPVVKTKLKERYGEKIPVDEPVISPGRIFASELLKTTIVN